MAAQLTKGQIDHLTVGDLTVSVQHSEPIDVSALLLNSAGRVRGERDLIFFNQNSGPGIRLADGQIPGVSIELRALPRDVEHVRVIVNLADQQAHFGDFEAPVLRVAGPGGKPLYEYVVDGLGRAGVVVALDLDRVGGAWQLRMIGEGYDAGFDALVTGHGVRVSGPGEQDPGYRGPAELAPGQEVSLHNVRSGDLTLVKMALGWDPVRGRGLRKVEVDLDASALMFAGDRVVDGANFHQLASLSGAARHSGDNVDGSGAGDDEIITVNLGQLPRHVTAVVFVVTSYKGHTFERVREAFWRMDDGVAGMQLARGNLRAGGAHTGMIVAKVYRDGSTWRMASIGAPIQATHPVEAIPQILPYL
ncbi:TerD family protein [Nocardia macrotermitis]|uniref:TerD family protein n=1 Tax=Nocardia macrotermitis TaxID=2585198 RepID=UPI0018863FDD|nr:TerD family protein [Nocardia macrotermitis]